MKNIFIKCHQFIAMNNTKLNNSSFVVAIMGHESNIDVKKTKMWFILNSHAQQMLFTAYF